MAELGYVRGRDSKSVTPRVWEFESPRGHQSGGIIEQLVPAARLSRSVRVLVVGPDAWRKLDPGVPAAVMDRDLRRGETRVGEGAHRDADRGLLVTLFGVEERRPADRAEPERESGSLIAHTRKLGGSARDSVRGGEAGQGRKDDSGSALAGQAVADADPDRLPLDLAAQLAAGAGRRPRSHF